MTPPQNRARELLASDASRAVWCAAFAAVGTQHSWAAMCRVLDLHGITSRDTYADEVALASAMLEHMRSRADAPAETALNAALGDRDQWMRTAELAADERDAARAELAAAVADRDSVNRQLTEDHDYSYALERQLRTLAGLAITFCEAAARSNRAPRGAVLAEAADKAAEQLRAAADAALSDATGEQQRTVARILAAWQRVPELRLGQFIANAIHPAVDTFHVEDETLALQCEEYARQATGRGEREGEDA